MRIFVNLLYVIIIDLGLEKDSNFVKLMLKKCMKRFMNINKLQNVISNSLNEEEISHQTVINQNHPIYKF